MPKRLYDTVINEYVPQDAFIFLDDDTNRIAQAIRNWEDVRTGEFWYPNHAEVHEDDFEQKDQQ